MIDKHAIRAGMTILIVVIFQLAWHAALNIDSTVTNAIREAYLHVESVKYGKAPGPMIGDILIPGLLAGFAFGRTCGRKPKREAWVYSGIVGLTVAILLFLYPYICTYELWWLAPDLGGSDSGLFLNGFVVGGLSCRIALAWSAKRDVPVSDRGTE